MKLKTLAFEEYSNHTLLGWPRSRETQKAFCLLLPLP